MIKRVILSLGLVAFMGQAHAASTLVCETPNSIVAEQGEGKGLAAGLVATDKYCFSTKAALKQQDIANFPTTSLAAEISKRYVRGYQELDSDDSKLRYAEEYLDNITSKYSVTIKESKGSIAVAIKTRTSRNKMSGFSVRLFPEPDGKRLSEAFIKYTEASKSRPKYSKGPQAKLSPLPVMRAFDETECDDQCQQDREDREADDEYREWAQEQAEGWGDDWYIGDWEWDADLGEEYLEVINFETGEYEEAYHFVPRAER